jgi:hypothetical protein
MMSSCEKDEFIPSNIITTPKVIEIKKEVAKVSLDEVLK